MRTKAHQEFFPSRLYLLCMNPKVVPQKLQNWILKIAGESCSRIWWCIIFNSDKGGVKEDWEGFLTDYWDASVSMACEKAKRSWRVRIVTSVTGRLPPTPSMQSLHKLRPVFPPHMASIGGYCCCVCSSEKKKKEGKKKKQPATARHSSTNLIMKSVACKQKSSWQRRSDIWYVCGALVEMWRDGYMGFSWFLEKYLSICVCVCVWTGLYLKSRFSANKASCLLLGWS